MIESPQNPIPRRSADGLWEWNGTQWIAAQQSPANPSPQRSADGLWEWNGTQWIAAQPPPAAQQVAQSVPVAQAAPTAYANPISPDGKLQWNGTAWMPIKKKGHLVRNIGIVLGALLLVGIGAALANNPSAQQQAKQAASDTFNSPAATAQATAAPAAPSQASLLAAYKAVIAKDNPAEVADINAITTDAGAQDVASLETDALMWRVDIAIYLVDLPTPPTCLKTAETQLRAGLTAYMAAATDMETGASTLDAALIRRASSEMTTGNGHINKATAAIKAATC